MNRQCLGLTGNHLEAWGGMLSPVWEGCCGDRQGGPSAVNIHRMRRPLRPSAGALLNAGWTESQKPGPPRQSSLGAARARKTAAQSVVQDGVSSWAPDRGHPCVEQPAWSWPSGPAGHIRAVIAETNWFGEDWPFPRTQENLQRYRF